MAAQINADYPDGYHLNLVDSVLRARFRNGWASNVLLVLTLLTFAALC